MRSFIVFFPLAFISFITFGQGNIELNLSVVTMSNKPASGLAVTAIETTSLKQVTGKTNPDGKSRLQLSGGREWAISIGEIKKCLFVEAFPGRMVTSSKFFVYDPADYKRKQSQAPNRSNEKFRKLDQQVHENTAFKPGECLLTVKLRRPDQKFLPGVTVEAVNLKDSLVYRAVTNEKGAAHFILPNQNKYEIDVNHIKNFSYADFGNDHRIHSLTLVYLPSSVEEQIVNDTIFQSATEKTEPSSDRSIIKITVQGGKKNGVRERVFLRQLPSQKIFASTTNDKGEVYFLIPFRFVYMIDFPYQKDVDAVNLKYASEFTTGTMRVQYSPDPRLEYPETFIPTPDRLLLKDFNQFLEKQYTKAKNKAFNLDIKSVKRINAQSREALFMLTLAGADLQGNVRLPLNAAFVLDKSGSMYSNDRSEALKLSLLKLGTALSDQDVVSVVLFDDNAVEVQHSTFRHLPALQLVADNYTPGGGTNILGGIEKGAESVMKNFDANRSNKIILLTDGYGDNPPKEITDFVEQKFGEGIEFSAIGLGSDYNQALLELVAQKGNGTFSFVDQSVGLSDAFFREVTGSMYYTAKDLRIEVSHNEKLIFSNLYGYPVSKKSSDRVSFDINKVSQITNSIAFLKFRLNNPSANVEDTPLKIKVSYFDLIKNQTVTYNQEIRLTWTNETDTELLLDHDEKKLYAIAILNQSMKLMAEAYQANNRKEARDVLKEGRKQIEDIYPDAKPKEVKALFDEVVRYLELFDQIEKNER